jgi:hypothetical protein
MHTYNHKSAHIKETKLPLILGGAMAPAGPSLAPPLRKVFGTLQRHWNLSRKLSSVSCYLTDQNVWSNSLEHIFL